MSSHIHRHYPCFLLDFTRCQRKRKPVQNTTHNNLIISHKHSLDKSAIAQSHFLSLSLIYIYIYIYNTTLKSNYEQNAQYYKWKEWHTLNNHLHVDKKPRDLLFPPYIHEIPKIINTKKSILEFNNHKIIIIIWK